ncbi:sodium:proton antiporter [Salinibacter altiplanensis]|uniref:sodium:proton antiporter n=1 Tax=Salinibacter altiplanensis TaxID=1803181 RepID=UPI000C9F5851|nr:NADH-quinone oxidoreductase subunit K [Salinibacter altiplanensis]
METLLALVTGAMVAISVYLLLQRDLVRKIIGVVILSNGIHLLIFAVGRMTRAASPLIPSGEKYPPEVVANPLSQALILTAIVIGFGLLAFSLVLIYRLHESYQSADADVLIEATLGDE